MSRVVFASLVLLACVTGLTGGAAALPRADLHVSTQGRDAGRCTAARPCASFDYAYRMAKPGQVVEVAGGRYEDMEIGVDRSKTSTRDVIFRPARGAKVSVAGEGITVFGRHVEFRSMAIPGGWYAKPGSDDVTFRNVVTANLFIDAARNIRMIGGSVGPGVNYDSQITGVPPPTNILIDGVLFHDWTRTDDSHVECLQFGSGVNVTIRNSTFRNCATHDVFVRSWGRGYTLRNWVVENNVFATTIEGYYSFKFKGDLNLRDCGGFLVRYNTATQAMLAESCPGRVTWIGNLAPLADCFGTKHDYNVWYGATARPCSDTDRAARDPGFVNERKLDVRLRAGSPAIDRGSTASFPRRDRAGRLRPAGRAPDAGAHEFRP